MKNIKTIFLSSILLTASLQINAMEKVTESKRLKENINEADLTEAARTGDIVKLKSLLKEGVNPDIKNKYGITALMFASYRSLYTEMVKELLKYGADKDMQDNCGETALFYAVRWGKTEIVKKLLKVGANKDKQNKYGVTALMWAAYNKNAEIVKKLLKAGADTTIKNKEDKTFYDLISDRSHIQEVVQNYQNQIFEEIYNSNVLPKELANEVAKILIERDVERVEESKEDN